MATDYRWKFTFPPCTHSPVQFFLKGMDYFSFFDNPISLFWAKILRKNEFLAVDKRTKIQAYCNISTLACFREIFHFGEYSIPWVSLKPGQIVIDIGANRGFFSLQCANRGAKVFAFEPETSNFSILRKNIKRNNFSQRISPFPWAVSKHSGKRNFFLSNDYGGMVHSLIPSFENPKEHCKTQEVQTISMEDIFSKFNLSSVKICKLDCEGAEFEIFQTLNEEILNRIDFFVLEIHSQSYPIVEFFDLMFSWKTHQIGFVPKTGNLFRKNVIFAIHNRVLKNLCEPEAIEDYLFSSN